MILSKILGIIKILEEKLFSIRYNDGYDSEFDRLMDLWNDVEYVYDYFEKNTKSLTTLYWLKNNWRHVRDSIPEQAQNFESLILDISEDKIAGKTLDDFFRPLNNFEPYLNLFQLSKGKNEEDPACLRIYAVRIGNDKYVITGGAIKLTESMHEHDDLKLELSKLEMAKEYLKEKLDLQS